MLESGKWDAALDAFDSVLKLDDTKKQYWLWRGVTNFERRKWAEVIQDASEAIAFDPKFEDAYAYRGFSRFFLDDIAGALEDFEKVQCTQKSQSSLAWYRAHANESFGQWRKAIRDYLLAYELDASNVAAGIGLARLQACCPDASLRKRAARVEQYHHEIPFRLVASLKAHE